MFSSRASAPGLLISRAYSSQPPGVVPFSDAITGTRDGAP